MREYPGIPWGHRQFEWKGVSTGDNVFIENRTFLFDRYRGIGVQIHRFTIYTQLYHDLIVKQLPNQKHDGVGVNLVGRCIGCNHGIDLNF